MEKLIEILNKYQEEKGSEIRFKRIDNSDFFVCGDDVGLGYETILSKKFGFIKWLVENNKIDFSKVRAIYKYKLECNPTYDDIGYYVIYRKYERILMLLAISENPISDLISVLK